MSDQDTKTGPVLTHAQTMTRMTELVEEIERLAKRDNLTAEDEIRWAELTTEHEDLDKHRRGLERAADLERIRTAVRSSRVEMPAGYSGSGGNGNNGGDFEGRSAAAMLAHEDPWDLSNLRTFGRSRDEVQGEIRSRALTAIEKMPHATDKVRAAATLLVEQGASENARFALESSSPTYMRAFTRLMQTKGKAMLSEEERESVTRAMSLTDNAGGYLIPFQLDPTVILTANGSANPIRQIGRVVNATGDVWAGISTAGVTGSWDAEAAEVSDDAPTLAQPQVPVYKGAIFVPISFEAREDESNVAGEVARMIAFEKDRMESVAFVTGTGVGEPTGIITALTGTASIIASATADTFALADVYALDSSLPARYAANASWVAHRGVANLVRRFDTNGGAALWTTLGNGMPQQLLGFPFYAAEAMDAVVNAGAENYFGVLGDFSNYVIADRVGTTIDYIPHLFGANRRPTGQSGWYAHFRVGADSVNDAAFRMLNVT